MRWSARTANRQLTAVDNAHSYLRSLLRNSAGDDLAEGGANSVAPLAAAAVLPQAPTPAASPSSAQDERLLARIAGIKSELLALDAAQHQRWVDAALADLAANRLLSAVISRRAAQGDVMHGVLGSVIVRLYATARYGDDWNQVPPEAA